MVEKFTLSDIFILSNKTRNKKKPVCNWIIIYNKKASILIYSNLFEMEGLVRCKDAVEERNKIILDAASVCIEALKKWSKMSQSSNGACHVSTKPFNDTHITS